MAQVCLPLDTLNNFMAQAKNQFTDPIYSWEFRHNPYFTVVPRSFYNYQDGITPEVLTSTFELPTSYPDSLSSVGVSTGTGNSACATDCATVLDGYISRNFHLVKDCFQTRPFCLTDLQYTHKAVEQAQNMQRLLQQYTTVRWSDWYRLQNICMIDTKISTGSGSNYDSASNTECDFSDVDLPTSVLSWSHLNCLYDELIRLGGEPVGYAEGQPLFTLTTGSALKRRLFQTNTLVRDTVNFGDAFQNFTARGINTSINGFIPNVDDFMIRYAANGTTKIYPTINANATMGRKSIANPDYKSVAKGGLAVYEAFTILPMNTWEVKVRPTGPTSFGSMTFEPQNYVGDPQWINNPDMCDNKLGNMGLFLMQLSMGAKPIRSDVGFTGITQVVDCE